MHALHSAAITTVAAMVGHKRRWNAGIVIGVHALIATTAAHAMPPHKDNRRGVHEKETGDTDDDESEEAAAPAQEVADDHQPLTAQALPWAGAGEIYDAIQAMPGIAELIIAASRRMPRAEFMDYLETTVRLNKPSASTSEAPSGGAHPSHRASSMGSHDGDSEDNEERSDGGKGTDVTTQPQSRQATRPTSPRSEASDADSRPDELGSGAQTKDGATHHVATTEPGPSRGQHEQGKDRARTATVPYHGNQEYGPMFTDTGRAAVGYQRDSTHPPPRSGKPDHVDRVNGVGSEDFDVGEYSKHGEDREQTIRPEKITWTTASHPDAVLALQMLFQTYFAAVDDALMLVGDVFTETLYSTAPHANKRLSEYIGWYIQREAAGSLPTRPSRYADRGAAGIRSAHTARAHANHLNYIGIYVTQSGMPYIDI